MQSSNGRASGCPLRVSVAGVIVVASLASLLILGYAVPAMLARSAEKAWAREVEPMDTFAARFPPEADSPAARALDQLTRPLGICLISNRDADSDDRKLNADVLKALDAVIRELGRSEDAVLRSPPADAESFLRREDGRIDAIVSHILHGGPLRWEQDIRKGMASPVPGLLGHRNLQVLLLSRALSAERGGRLAETDDALEASWLLSTSLLDRPELISQLVAMAASKMQHGVLRSIGRPRPVWFARTKTRPFASGFARALQLEACHWTLLGRDGWEAFDQWQPPKTRRGRAESLGRAFTAPVMRLSAAVTSKGLLRARRELSSQRRCDLDIDAYEKRFEDSLGRWNVMGRFGVASFTRAWANARWTDLDRELTERILSARADHAASGRWPTGDAASAVCEGVSWERRPAADGTLLIRASAKPFPIDDPTWGWAVRLRP